MRGIGRGVIGVFRKEEILEFFLEGRGTYFLGVVVEGRERVAFRFLVYGFAGLFASDRLRIWF